MASSSYMKFNNMHKGRCVPGKEKTIFPFPFSNSCLNSFSLPNPESCKDTNINNMEMEPSSSVSVPPLTKPSSRMWWVESKNMWEIAAPAMITAVTQFSLSFVTAAFVGHLGALELAAVSIVQNVLEGFVYGVMLGMGSALETLCGQAVGAGQLDMLGVYMQRSWIISMVTAFCLVPVYALASPILKLLRQDKHISELAGKFAIWVIPQLFLYALNFPLQKFLQAQSKVWVMTSISSVVLGIHAILNWVFVTKLRYGLVGAAIVADFSWLLVVLGQIIYVISGYFPQAWTGFSWKAFNMNIQLWTLMVALGFNAAISVRVSNELGAGNHKAAKFSVVLTIVTSTVIGAIFTGVVLATKDEFPKLFTSKPEVIEEASKLGYFLAATIFLDSILPVLHGVAVGAGWQFQVALVNIVCYYVFGLPIGAVLGYKFDFGVKGIWSGMLIGIILQIVFLLYIIYKTNWQKEAADAEERVRNLGGNSEPQRIGTEEASANNNVLKKRETLS
ncbi:Protein DETOXIFICATION 33 [Linum perenne]